ncbi:MAG TPA: hypothetical protein VF413_01735 [Cellulomonas sp.]
MPGFKGRVRGHADSERSSISKRFDDVSGRLEPWHVTFLLNPAADQRIVVLAGAHRDLLTGTDTTGAVDLGPEGAVALIERTS